MPIQDRHIIDSIKQSLIAQLKREHAFWSYNEHDITLENIDDAHLIAMTMRHLDLPEIKKLFKIYPLRKIKDAWIRLLVTENDYLYTLNRFFAWYYFKAKKPDSYLKSLQTRYHNKITAIS
jgi:hypothetical protein